MSNPLLLPEIVASAIENVHQVPDLLNCACVKRMWNVAALKKLYRGSLHDMQFCTPDIGSLNCLFVASRERFARYMSFMKHLLLSTDTMAVEQFAPLEQFAGTASQVVLPASSSPKMKGQDWSTISDLLFTPTIEYLAIDSCYCELAMNGVSYSQGSIIPTVSVVWPVIPPIFERECLTLGNKVLKPQSSHNLQTRCWRPADGIGRDDLAEVLLCLRQHQNLEMLALILSHCASPSRSTRVKEQVNTWPRLKALYLQEQSQEWLELLPTLDELQILQLPTISPRPPTFKQTVLRNMQNAEIYGQSPLDFMSLTMQKHSLTSRAAARFDRSSL
ncbi:hypothetical protein BA78_0030 [Aspergillus fumigatus]|nr:hypothetical protein BA78_0030 [Aspergillus fumigatus]